jgi:predicted nucleic acid-binding protein
MTRRVVIDNSVIMRWFHPSGTAKELKTANQILSSLEAGKIIPVAPFILVMEFINVLHTLSRKGVLKGNIETAVLLFENLGFEIISIDYNANLYIQALSDLCLKYGISAYDAAYLELAGRLNCPLLTLDKDLGKAAFKAGLKG